MTRASAAHNPGVSLFPFLAVLICTMGVMMLLLVIINRPGAAAIDDSTPPPDAVFEEGGNGSAATLASGNGGASPAASDELQSAREMVDWRISQLETSREKTVGDLRDERLRLATVEDGMRKLRDQWELVKKAAGDIAQADKAKDYDKQSVAALVDRLHSDLSATHDRIGKAIQEARSEPPAYAIVPYDGPNGTRRQPIYIECRNDAVVLQPEGIELTEQDFKGPAGPGNPLASTVRAARDYLAGGTAPTPGREPYPLLIVRSDGIVAFYMARSAMSSWASDYGYELIEADRKLIFQPPTAQLAQIEKAALADARARYAWFATTRTGQEQQEPRERPVYRASRTGGIEREGEASLADADGPSTGSGTGTSGFGIPGSRFGSGNGSAFAGTGAAGGGNGSGFGTGGNGSGFGTGGNGGAFAGTGTGTGSSGIGTGGTGIGNGGTGGGNGGIGSGNGNGNGTGATGVALAGGPGGGQAYVPGSNYIGLSGGAPNGSGYGTGGYGYGSSGTGGTAGAGGTGSGIGPGTGSGMGPGGGSGNGLSGGPAPAPGSGYIGVAGNSGSGGSGYGTGGAGSSMGSGPNGNQAGGPGGIAGGPVGYGSGNSSPGGSGLSGGPAGGTGSGVPSGSNTGTNSPGSFNGSSGVPGGNMSAGQTVPAGTPGAMAGDPSSLPPPGTPASNLSVGQAGAGGSSSASDAGDSSSPSSMSMMVNNSQPPQHSISDIYNINATPYPVQSGPTMPHPGEYVDSPPPPTYSDKPKPPADDPSRNHDSLAEKRGRNWSLPATSKLSTPVSRTIHIECRGDCLILKPDFGNPTARVIKFGPRTADSVDKLVAAVWDYTKGWGIAGRQMYWKPRLELELGLSGEGRYSELQALLADSGLELARKQSTTASATQLR